MTDSCLSGLVSLLSNRDGKIALAVDIWMMCDLAVDIWMMCEKFWAWKYCSIFEFCLYNDEGLWEDSVRTGNFYMPLVIFEIGMTVVSIVHQY